MNLSKINRFNFIKTGVFIVAIACFLMHDRTFFFYPPSVAPFWNDIYFDGIGLFAGVMLMTAGITGSNNEWLVKLGLALSVAFLSVMLVAELFHVIGAGYFRFHLGIILEIYAIVNIMQLAYEREPNNKS